MRRFLLPIAVTVSLSMADLASAQGARVDDDYRYRFDDDHLVGETISGTPPLLRGMKRGVRVRLLRPRASFVSEMVRDVERM